MAVCYPAHHQKLSSMASPDGISNYPFLTEEDFSLACHLLDQRYITATLGQERRAFRLRIQHSMISDSAYITITRPIDISKNDTSLSLDLQTLSWGGEDEVMMDTLMDVDAENADFVRIRTFQTHSQEGLGVIFAGSG